MPLRLPNAAETLGLTPDLLRQLDRAALAARRPIAGSAPGQRRSPRLGSSVELADHREYEPGDDLRRVDWNAYARLDRLLLRLYRAEEDLCVTLWLDVSLSMGWGDPPKWRSARGIAAAIAYTALSAHERAAVVTFAGSLISRVGPLRGRAGCTRLWQAIASAPTQGTTDFTAVGQAARSVPRGLAVVVSDFLADPGPGDAVASLRRAGHDVYLVQVLAPQELEPELRGDLRLVDVETQGVAEISAVPAVLRAYRARLLAHGEWLVAMSRAYGVGYVSVSSQTPLRRVLLDELVRRGLLR